MNKMNKNADKFSLWGFLPCRRYLQLCILISEWPDPAPTGVTGKTHLIKRKRDLLLTDQNMKGESLFQVGAQMKTHFRRAFLA